MKYSKPKLIAKNNPKGSYAAGCPVRDRGPNGTLGTGCAECDRAQ